MSNEFLIVAFFAIAFLYASVGHGGASGYIALLTLAHFSPPEIRPVALILNVGVSALAAYRFMASGYQNKALLYPLIFTSVPFATLGGSLHLSVAWLKFFLGVFLIFSASYLLVSPIIEDKMKLLQRTSLFSVKTFWGLGSGLGLISGLTGVGGGIFLSPILLLFKQADAKTVAGVSSVFIFVNSLAGLLPQIWTGISLPNDLPFWMLGAFSGGFLGASFGAKRFQMYQIKLILALVLGLAAWKMFQ